MSSDQEQNEVDMEEQIEEPKKGRGRPKKAASKAKADEKSSDEPVVKRGRGRPPGGASKPKDKVEKAPKPKKNATDAENGDADDAGTAPPKRRGRPAKAAAKEKEPEPESPSASEEEEESEEAEPAPPAKSKATKGKKATKNGHAKEEDVEEDDAEEKSEKSDAASSDSRIKIVVEHCKSCHTYRKKAEEIITALKVKWSNIDVEYNPSKPRKGSFEINLVGSNGSDIKLWTGLDLGPPRKLKFPEPDAVVEAMEKAYLPESA